MLKDPGKLSPRAKVTLCVLLSRLLLSRLGLLRGAGNRSQGIKATRVTNVLALLQIFLYLRMGHKDFGRAQVSRPSQALLGWELHQELLNTEKSCLVHEVLQL